MAGTAQVSWGQPQWECPGGPEVSNDHDYPVQRATFAADSDSLLRHLPGARI